MQNRFFRPLIAFAVLSVSIYLARDAALRSSPAIRYELCAEFAEVPADDRALEEWLRNEPGVSNQSSYVNREQNAIRISWEMSRDTMGYPPRPDFIKNFGRLGYHGLKQYESR